jgi:uncharacterized protein (DUF2147 family)
MIRTATALVLAVAASSATAQGTPAGLWKTIDDASKKEKSLVRIVEQNGVYVGRIERLLDPDAPKDAVCKDCTDERKEKPIVGMTIIRNVKPAADDKATFEGGDILDPNNGKLYKVRLKVAPDNARLDVRGYIGTPMIGRTQVWTRVE